MTALQRAILRTLAYYDVFSYPLTAAELRRWLYPAPGDDVASANEEEVRQALKAPPLQDAVASSGEWWFLRGRQEIVQIRGIRAAASFFKWEIAADMARWLQMVPFVEMIAVVNTLAIDNARPESDIDFLIVTEPGKLWLTRLLVTGLVHLRGRRRHGKKITNRICLSYYVTSDALDLSPWRLDDNDHHYRFWISQAVPLLDNGTYERFVKENTWVTEGLPHAFEGDAKAKLQPRDPLRQSVQQIYRTLLGAMGAAGESMARAVQRRWMVPHLTGQAEQLGHHVVISDAVLKFHEADRREQYRQEFLRRLNNLGL